MTSVTTNASADSQQQGERVRALSPEAALRDPSVLVMASLLGIAFIALFWSFIDRQLGIGLFGLRPGFSWNYPEDWGHSYLVPLIAGYHVWLHRERWKTVRLCVYWPGLLPLALGVMCFFYFATVFSNHMFQGASFVLTLSGLVLLLMGPRAYALLFFPIAFLMLGVTISEIIMLKVTFVLQQVAATGSWVLLNILQIDTELHGNTLNVYTASGEALPLNVAEACSGMRMVIAFIALSTAVAFFGVRDWWQRTAVILLGLPVAVLMNVFRVAVLGVLSLIDPNLASGNAHMLVGMVLLVPSFALFMGCVWVLRRVTPDDEAIEKELAS